MANDLLRKDPLIAAAAAILALAAATIIGAFIFEAFGYAPCELCLKERIPYYAGIAVAALALGAAAAGYRRMLPAALAGLALIFIVGTIFGVYHSGVEWGFWPGPTDCTGNYHKSGSAEDFIKQVEATKVVRCDAVAIRILGLSLAGWNAVISAVLVGLAAAGVLAWRRNAAMGKRALF
jgi:disulfide bond formation protein DsbB